MESSDHLLLEYAYSKEPDSYQLLDPDPSFVFLAFDTKSGKCLHLLGAVDMVLGYSRTTLIKKDIGYYTSLISEEDIDSLKEFFLSFQQQTFKCNHQLLSTKSVEFRFLHGSGKWIWIEFDFVYFSPSKVLLGVLKDVDLRRRREEFIQKWLKGLSLEELEEEDRQPNSYISDNTNIATMDRCRISSREKEVLYLIADGYSAKEIADKLHISPHTAINHRKNLISKFMVKNTAELVKEASRYFWL